MKDRSGENISINRSLSRGTRNLAVKGATHDLVQTLRSTETSRSHANDEDVNVTAIGSATRYTEGFGRE